MLLLDILWLVTSLLWWFGYSVWTFYRYLNNKAVPGPCWSYGSSDLEDVGFSILLFGIIGSIAAPFLLVISIPIIIIIGSAYLVAKSISKYKIEIKK